MTGPLCLDLADIKYLRDLVARQEQAAVKVAQSGGGMVDANYASERADWLAQLKLKLDAMAEGSDEVRSAAMWVVLNWDAERSQHGTMPALRAALGLPSQPPTYEEGLKRLNEYIGIKGGEQ